MSLPVIVDEVVGVYLEMIDAEAPGLVEGLYLVGSAALGDFRPHSSYIDFVAVTATRPEPAELAGLRRVHNRLHQRWPRPYFDGGYVTWDDLANDPAQAGPGAHTHEGRFRPPIRRVGTRRSPGTCWPTMGSPAAARNPRH